jgi:hypothetical protein
MQIKNAINNNSVSCPVQCPDVIFACFRLCWSINGDDRPSAKDIVRRIRIFDMGNCYTKHNIATVCRILY